MCHVYGTTIDGDRFFLKKELLKENPKNILAEKRRLEISSSSI
jgi:hypothetical protein